METFEPGQQVCSEGDLGDRVHVLGAGMVKIGRADRARRCRQLAVLGPGQLVDAFLSFSTSRREVTAVAMTAATTLRVAEQRGVERAQLDAKVGSRRCC
ncbi:cyclic nucleotide-binding domain-containing protein [Crossiella sp. CA-258035]|uniref:cyclic nucleotide-binding domain-containing protein n=1 Tax=Crossiella sp. CA-258035 TaxID=2981138 RepID=UPI0024BCC3EE|nr:cyclic nucleotide-binding domain-containing protein [Crossiella sp. CA-258035]WHT16137.1 cyclic nucleotide-binding domain-containing protein [Crossiella sp. CA-258035]